VLEINVIGIKRVVKKRSKNTFVPFWSSTICPLQLKKSFQLIGEKKGTKINDSKNAKIVVFVPFFIPSFVLRME